MSSEKTVVNKRGRVAGNIKKEEDCVLRYKTFPSDCHLKHGFNRMKTSDFHLKWIIINVRKRNIKSRLYEDCRKI